MASGGNNDHDTDQVVPEDSRVDVRSIQSRYLRYPSPSSLSEISETDAESIFQEPIHLSSAVAARKIIREELKPRAVKVKPVPESMLESARQLMVEDLYNRVKDMTDDTSSYNTPCVMDIQRAILQDRLEAPLSPVDEVWPSIFIAERSVAVNKSRLKRMGITHILNAAHGTGVYTSKDFYAGMKIRYHGVEVDDFPHVDISPHFRKAAEYLDEALLTHQGKVLVNSVMGISRAAVLVAAYLMIFHHMTIMEALLTLRQKRAICPNEGFLKQLRQLNEALLQERAGDELGDTLSQGSTDDGITSWEPEPGILSAEEHSISVEKVNGENLTSSVVVTNLRHALTESNPQRQDQASTPPNEQHVNDNTRYKICEWQQRNEGFHSEERWQAQPMREDTHSILAGSYHHSGALDGVRNAEVQAFKENACTRRMEKHPQERSESTVRRRYDGMEQQLLREAEKGVAYHGHYRHLGESKMTVLEDINLKAYQAWKLKQHKKIVSQNNDEVLELSRGQVSAAVNRKPDLENSLQYSGQDKANSQPMFSGRTKSLLNYDSVPISNVWLNVSNKAAGNTTSQGNMQSSTPSQSHSELDQLLVPPFTPFNTAPEVRVESNTERPQGVNVLSFQSWVSNVGTDILLQNHDECLAMEENMPPNLVNSIFSLDAQSCRRRTFDEGEASLLSEDSYSRALSQSRPESEPTHHKTSSRPGKGADQRNIRDNSRPLFSLIHDKVNPHKPDALDKEMKYDTRARVTTSEIQMFTADLEQTIHFEKKKPREESEDDEDD